MSLLTASVDAPPEVIATTASGDRPAGAAVNERCRRRLVLAVVAILGVLVGAVGSAGLVTASFLSAAEDIGRGMSEGLESLAEPPAQDLATGGGGPVERFSPVAPGALGTDPVLDGYARSCFAGDLSACDALWQQSPPMSDYETYAATCGGRAKRGAVTACSELG